MNIIFVSRILDNDNNPASHIISSVPPVTIAAIANSKILDGSNTGYGLYVVDSQLDKNIVAKEIEDYLNSNPETKGFKKGFYQNGTVWFEW